MRVEHIRALGAKTLTEDINRFLEHVTKTYKDDPYIEIFSPAQSGDPQYWNAFVIFRDMRERNESNASI